MDVLRALFLVAGAVLVVVGAVAVVWLELGSAPSRRLVSRARDLLEVLLPPLLALVLVVAVWWDRV